MSVATPEWLSKRDGKLRPNVDGHSWTVSIGGNPLYVLKPIPVGGKFGCEVFQSNNDRRLGGAAGSPTIDEALKIGLDELRKVLGW